MAAAPSPRLMFVDWDGTGLDGPPPPAEERSTLMIEHKQSYESAMLEARTHFDLPTSVSCYFTTSITNRLTAVAIGASAWNTLAAGTDLRLVVKRRAADKVEDGSVQLKAEKPIAVGAAPPTPGPHTPGPPTPGPTVSPDPPGPHSPKPSLPDVVPPPSVQAVSPFLPSALEEEIIVPATPTASDVSDMEVDREQELEPDLAHEATGMASSHVVPGAGKGKGKATNQSRTASRENLAAQADGVVPLASTSALPASSLTTTTATASANPVVTLPPQGCHVSKPIRPFGTAHPSANPNSTMHSSGSSRRSASPGSPTRPVRSPKGKGVLISPELGMLNTTLDAPTSSPLPPAHSSSQLSQSAAAAGPSLIGSSKRQRNAAPSPPSCEESSAHEQAQRLKRKQEEDESARDLPVSASAAPRRSSGESSDVSMRVGLGPSGEIEFVPKSPERTVGAGKSRVGDKGDAEETTDGDFERHTSDGGFADDDSEFADDEVITSARSQRLAAGVKKEHKSSPLPVTTSTSSNGASSSSTGQALKHHSSASLPRPSPRGQGQSPRASAAKATFIGVSPERSPRTATVSTTKRKASGPMRMSSEGTHKRLRFDSPTASSPRDPVASTSRLSPIPSTTFSASQPQPSTFYAQSQSQLHSQVQSQPPSASQPTKTSRRKSLPKAERDRQKYESLSAKPRAAIPAPSQGSRHSERWYIWVRLPNEHIPPRQAANVSIAKKREYLIKIQAMGAQGTTEGRTLGALFEQIGEMTGWEVNDLRFRFQPEGEKEEEKQCWGSEKVFAWFCDLEDWGVGGGSVIDVDYMRRDDLQ